MTSPRVLIVEDSEDTRLLLSMRLKAAGYETSFATNMRQAITAASRLPPDVMLLDLGLPDCSGFSVLEKFKGIPALANIPIIIVSAEEADVMKTRALQSGASAYLQKPVSRDSLIASVRLALHEGSRYKSQVVSDQGS